MRSLRFLLGLVCWALALGAHAQTTRLVLVHGDDYPPFSFGTGGGAVPDGLLPRIAEAVFAGCPGVRLEQLAVPWSRAQNLLKAGEVQAIMTIPTEERLVYLKASATPVITPRMLSFAASQNPKINELRSARTLADFKPFRIGTYAGSGWSREHLQGFNVDYSTSRPGQVFKMLDGGRFDMTFENSIVASYYIQREGLQGRIESLPASDQGKTAWHLLVRRDLAGADAVLDCFERQLRTLRKAPAWNTLWRAAGVDAAAE
jgi:polar amino acid transport system substrate-binding protein